MKSKTLTITKERSETLYKMIIETLGYPATFIYDLDLTDDEIEYVLSIRARLNKSTIV